MILKRLLQAFVIICVLVFSCRGLESEDKTEPCKITVETDYISQLNCSRRNFHAIPDFSAYTNGVNEDVKLIVTFYGNNITNITQLSTVKGPLIALNLQENQIVEIFAGAFAKIEKLNYLDLSHNNLTGEVLRSEIFQGPYKDGVYGNIALKSLYLGYNQIHSLDHYLFQYTPNLTQLSLTHNPLEILDHVTVDALSSAVNLEVLDLSYTGIDNLPFEALRGLLNLRSIDLSGNKFFTVPESLGLVGNTLEDLYFNNNAIVELNDDSFNGLNNLNLLEVGECSELQEVKRSTFSPLKSLRVLHLCHNPKLRYISHNAFRGLKNKWTIKEVYLDQNKLSELSSDLMPWNKLDRLSMKGNLWLCNCELANIVTQGAGEKFDENEIPTCEYPRPLHGEYLTNISNKISFCHTFDQTFKTKKSFSLGDLKPKHVLWSVFGVASIVAVGMLLGLLVNAAKAFYKKKFHVQPTHYINLNEDSIDSTFP